MVDTKLKPLYREVTFWVLLAISLPGIVAMYLAALHGIQTDSFDETSFLSAAFASPIVLYLGIGRQYARGKAVEAAGVQAAAMDPLVESNPPAGATDGEVVPEADVTPDVIL